MPAGRPSIYTQAIADELCHRLSGGESMRSICRGPPGFDPLLDTDRHSHLPDLATVMRWAINPNHEFCGQYEKAREAQMEGCADRLEEIAVDPDLEPSRARLLSDNIKWSAARMASRRFGDRTTHEHTGTDGKELGVGATTQLANLIASAMNKKDDDEPLV